MSRATHLYITSKHESKYIKINLYTRICKQKISEVLLNRVLIEIL